MRLIGTKRDSLESEAIRWGTKGDCSHFAAVFYEDTVPVVMQSNFLGVDFQSYKMFSQAAQVVREIKFDMDQKREDEIFDSIVNSMVGQDYDWGAFAYFTLCGILNRFFGTPFPSKNKWARSDRALCVEMANSLPDEVVPAWIKSKDLSMVSPCHLFDMLEGKAQ